MELENRVLVSTKDNLQKIVLVFAVFFQCRKPMLSYTKPREFCFLDNVPGKCTITAVLPLKQECVTIMIPLLGLKCSAIYGGKLRNGLPIWYPRSEAAVALSTGSILLALLIHYPCQRSINVIRFYCCRLASMYMIMIHERKPRSTYLRKLLENVF